MKTIPDDAQLWESLIGRCAAGDAVALSEFEARSHRLIAATVIKAARRLGDAPKELVDDLVQDTYVRLFDNRSRVLRNFKTRHPGGIYGYLQSVTYSVVHDNFDRTHAQKRGGDVTIIPIDSARAAAAQGQEEYERVFLLKQVDAIVDEVAPSATRRRDRLIFWLHHRHGFTAKEISDLPDVELTAKGVESVLNRLMSDVRRKVEGKAG